MADSPQGPPGLAVLLKSLAPFAPGVAGAVLSLTFAEHLTIRGKAASVAIGLAAAFWVAPALVDFGAYALSISPIPLSAIAAASFLFGLFAMTLFTGLALALAKYAKDPLRLVKIQFGGVSIGGDAGGEA